MEEEVVIVIPERGGSTILKRPKKLPNQTEEQPIGAWMTRLGGTRVGMATADFWTQAQGNSVGQEPALPPTSPPFLQPSRRASNSHLLCEFLLILFCPETPLSLFHSPFICYSSHTDITLFLSSASPMTSLSQRKRPRPSSNPSLTQRKTRTRGSMLIQVGLDFQLFW
ncbi:hypothetical protein K438DRAFT_770845 [Mycena galopus ATCC 62051]|nr:hypothetical protein K438DRAFT_770845 [Mycena galopus ATCC 62051]